MKLNPRVEILMATYEGEEYIDEQLQSLLNQTYENWTLLIRDDGSTDKTLEIIQKYEKKKSDRIKLLKDNKGSLGAKDNFLELLKNSKEDYIMFCDQDDIWLPNKIEITLKKMLKVQEGPTLIHTDLKVVDKNLNILSNSFWKLQNLDPARISYNYMIVQNNITGCTAMLNRELVNLSKGEFPNGIMHDWIIGIIAALKGKIDYIEEPTILYRQHSRNSIGAKNYFQLAVSKLKNIKFIKSSLYQTNYQLSDILKNLNLETTEYVKLVEKNFIYRKYWILKNNYLKKGALWKIAQIILY